jgi:hypothetical protein
MNLTNEQFTNDREFHFEKKPKNLKSFSSVRRSFNNLSSAITNRLWLNAHTNYQCDVLLTFPSRVDDYVIIWFLEQLHQLTSDIHISIKYHFTTGECSL